MTAYVFDKEERKVFNKVENVISIKENIIISNNESMILSQNDDFIITNRLYNINDVIPVTENNKTIKTEFEILKETVEELVLANLGV